MSVPASLFLCENTGATLCAHVHVCVSASDTDKQLLEIMLDCHCPMHEDVTRVLWAPCCKTAPP